MSLISISNLSFSYGDKNIFDGVSFNIDTDWKLGFCGRNGKGKTTFLNLLLGKHEYSGSINASVKFDYFPFDIVDTSQTVYDIAQSILPQYSQWQLDRELNLLQLSVDSRWRAFDTLSGGEQTKIKLAVLFLNNDNFLLIDEPTNHLDAQSRQVVSQYLNTKKGFILVSHDRHFLDCCVDHILSINKSSIELQQGNFSSWHSNKQRQDNFELGQNQKLNTQIDKLQIAAKQKANWSNQAEAKKSGAPDRGFMGAKAARQMKTAKIIESRIDKSIVQKSELLKDIDRVQDLKITHQKHSQQRLAWADNLVVRYDGRDIFAPLSFEIVQGDRIAITGKNGSGKSSLLKLLVGQSVDYGGRLTLASKLNTSFVTQDSSNLSGTLDNFIIDNKIEKTLFLALLDKLGVFRLSVADQIQDLSQGQKKKIILAKSLCDSANLYVWDEPLNYIDIISRTQIENTILQSQPTIIFVEHDQAFVDNVATKNINISL